MDSLNGSDTRDHGVSTQSDRCSALKEHLKSVVLILESLDQVSQDDLEEDDDYNDLVHRFLSTFTTLPLPDVTSRVDQIIKSGLNGISANIAQLSFRGLRERKTMKGT